jgi:hypothetical protein
MLILQFTSLTTVTIDRSNPFIDSFLWSSLETLVNDDFSEYARCELEKVRKDRLL